MKKVSIQDIADSLKLSRNTVSKAINNNSSVSDDTKYKIIKKAVELGYTKIKPEFLAKFENMKHKGVKNIALITRKEISEFWYRIMNGISEELSKKNYNLFYNYISNEDEKSLTIPGNIANQDVSGVIVLSVFSEDYVKELHESGLPMVFLDAPVGKSGCDLPGDLVIMDSQKGVYDITKDLIHRGCRKIGFIGDTTYCRTIFERWLGFKTAMNEENIPIDESICFTKKSPLHYYNFDELSDVLKSMPEMPQAIVCSNDTVALFLMKFLNENGYKIPGDIAITGFDDISNALIMEPHLTTVHVCNEQIGKRLVEELLYRIENPERVYETVIVSTSVMIRESSNINISQN